LIAGTKFVFTNFWHARWDVSASHLFLQTTKLYAFSKTIWPLRTPYLNVQGELFDPHLKDQQPLALYLAES